MELDVSLPTEQVETAGAADPFAGLTRRNSLSPSRASDFMSCPLLYRFRVIDKLPEAPSVDAVRGSVVHKVLEDLFDLPAYERTHDRANELLPTVWEDMIESAPEVAELFGGDQADGDAFDLLTWLDQCRALLGRYFTLEDPQRLEPAEREVHVATRLDTGLTLHGYIDRVDITPAGDMRIVDYKTGKSPGELFEAKALFQMKFYALVIWRTRGVIPRMLQLVYLGNGEVLRYEPDERDLLATERKVRALWDAISRANETGDWRPNKSVLCGWCDHKAICPAWGGTPPPLPVEPSSSDVPTANL
ncbi:MAG: PD-(D/E)XK nuclease family protein [Propionibacteriales bacterium]|nr:PD-(D/E)XK nuclease family protein [Propionibacteriales bacterium]